MRKIDDEVYLRIKEADTLLEKMLLQILRERPESVGDILIQTWREIGPGGVKIFAEERKKEAARLMILQLLFLLPKRRLFVKSIKAYKLIRKVKERIVLDNDDLVIDLDKYFAIKKSVILDCIKHMSPVIMGKYSSWGSHRTGAYDLVKDDIQNTYFSVQKAFGLFDTGQHVSFFSYASRWMREGLSSSDFAYRDSTDVPIEEVVDSLFVLPEEDNESEKVDVLTELGAQILPMPVELRIYNLVKGVDNEMDKSEGNVRINVKVGGKVKPLFLPKNR